MSTKAYLYAIAALVKLNKVSIIAIIHEYAFLGKDKTFHSNALCKNVIVVKPITVCLRQSYVIAMTDAEVDLCF